MAGTGPSDPWVASLKRATLLSSSILTVISSDKMGEKFNFLGLEVSGEGHQLFVLLVILVTTYYAVDYFWRSWALIKRHRGPEFPDSHPLLKRISREVGELRGLRDDPPNRFSEFQIPQGFSDDDHAREFISHVDRRIDELKNYIDEATGALLATEIRLIHLFRMEYFRLMVFDLVVPLFVLVFALAHGIGEFYQICPTFMD